MDEPSQTMTVTVVAASPRTGGQSSRLAEGLREELEGRGHRVNLFVLAGQRYGGCTGCRACKGRVEGCALRDGLTPVLESILGSEAVVLSTGVYFGDLPSQAKAVLDRFYGYYRPQFWALDRPSLFPRPKILGFLLVQADPDPNLYSDIAERYAGVLKPMGWETPAPLRFIGRPEGPVDGTDRALVADWVDRWNRKNDGKDGGRQ